MKLSTMRLRLAGEQDIRMAGMGLPPQGMMPPDPSMGGMPPPGMDMGMMPPAEPPMSAVFPMATPSGAEQLLAMFEQQKQAEHKQLGQMHDEVGMMLMQGLQAQEGGESPLGGYAEGAGMNTIGAAPMGPEGSQLPPELLAMLAGGQLG